MFNEGIDYDLNLIEFYKYKGSFPLDPSERSKLLGATPAVSESLLCAQISELSQEWLNLWGINCQHQLMGSVGPDQDELAILGQVILESFLEDVLKIDHTPDFETFPNQNDLLKLGRRPGFGVLFLELKIAGVKISCVIDGKFIQHIVFGLKQDEYIPKMDLFTRFRACSEVTVNLQVFFKRTFIPVSDLHQVKVGDVIKLDHLIADPVVFGFGADSVVGQCYLGRLGENKAVSIA